MKYLLPYIAIILIFLGCNQENNSEIVSNKNAPFEKEYNVNVMIDEENTKTSESFTTFFRGDIRQYFADDPNP